MGEQHATQCQDCGMNHDPDDKAACIEGHGDDPIESRQAEIERINHLANRALENLYGGWLALLEGQLHQIIEATGALDQGAIDARAEAQKRRTVTPIEAENREYRSLLECTQSQRRPADTAREGET